MEKLCVIFGAGETFSPRKAFSPDTLIIAADGGYVAASDAGVSPDIIIGDFDSAPVPEGVASHVVKLKPEKDDTDTLAAVKLGLRRGCRTFAIYGGVGSRLDHTLANIAVLRYLNSFDAQGYLIDRDSVCTVVTDGKFVLPKSSRGIISVFAYGGVASGVTLASLKYKLENATLTPDFPLGVSNETVSSSAPPSVTVKDGSLLIFFPRPQ